MASTSEQVLNFALGEVLREKHPLWKNAISAEQTKVLKNSPGKQPDIIMSLEGSSPVVIETEFMPGLLPLFKKGKLSKARTLLKEMKNAQDSDS